ncbi:MAG: TIGR03905 family TSCPD domain-containing protein [Clostridiales bacterium]|nr:TIGR03905 family TSCPD domain-containing protein [Clostridiales bacterium]
MTYNFKVSGVCSKSVSFEIENDRIGNVSFIGGCSGNTQGVSRLIDGMGVNEAIARIKGIKCGHKNTSCPDQLAKAIENAVMRENKPE